MKQTMEHENNSEPTKRSADKENDEIDSLFKRKKCKQISIAVGSIKKYYREIFQKNNVAILIVDGDNGNIVNANLVACEFYGYRKNQIKKLKITEIDCLYKNEITERLQKSLDKHFQKLNSKHRLANNEIIDVEIHSGPLKMLEKKFVYLIIEDISERVKLENELKRRETQYRELFENASEAVFFGAASEDGIPERFIDVNNRACNLLKYSKEKILKKSPLEICFFKDYKNKFLNDSVNKVTKRAVFETKIIVKNGVPVLVEISIHIFKLKEKVVFLAIVRDITERKAVEEKIFQNSKLLEGVLEGITDIIGVCDPDSRVMFYNRAGYEFFQINPEDINGKRCFEILHRNKKCDNCPIEKIIETRKIVRTEKYIPELDKYLDCCCNPVLDDSGDVIYIINQLRDITEEKILEKAIKESEERYRQIVNLLPEAMVITVDGRVVLANKKASEYFDNIIGQKVTEILHGSEKIIEKRIKQIIEDKVDKTVFDYKTLVNGSKMIDIEISSNYLNYQGKPAIMSVIRNVTKKKNELNAAARMQKQLFRKPFAIPDRAKMEALYVPAKTVSGDFFYLSKKNDDVLIGVVGDVSGKGITAALNISAFNVLFHEAILTSDQPSEILINLNRKVGNYLGERYVAACCFRFDFKEGEAKIVGAGINQFIFQDREKKCTRKIIKGSFLGMFEDSIFDEEIIQFNTGDRFYFYTDGLDFIFDDDKMNDIMLETPRISRFTNNLRISLNEMLTDVEGIQDDCTLIAMEIK
ncbi:PAS domain S-box protein [Wukongibacter baidiensis]|uniref:PAS domain S-box protein n=1 Tax=Wukongibacter baidiensis TaxID=1723361 RepID=UPI003D7F3EFB